MAGAKKRAGSQIASAVRPKSPRKSTVAESLGTQIPKENFGGAKGIQIQEKPPPLENVFKKRDVQRVPRCETPKNIAPKSPKPEVKLLEKATPSIPVKSPKKKFKKLPKTPEILWKDIKNLSPGTGAILDCFMKQHNESLSNLKRRDSMTSKKMREITMDALKKNTENVSLNKK